MTLLFFFFTDSYIIFLYIQELVLALGYEKCVLVVHDWGGAVGFSFAIKNPDMVEKFIVCNIPHPL